MQVLKDKVGRYKTQLRSAQRVSAAADEARQRLEGDHAKLSQLLQVGQGELHGCHMHA